MVKLTLRLDETTRDKLKALANAERRSVNNMLIELIERAAAGQDRSDSPRP